MPSKRPRITVYLTPEEHTQISEYATRAGLSLSTFAKRVCTGAAVPTLAGLAVCSSWLSLKKAKAATSSPCNVCCGRLKPGNSS